MIDCEQASNLISARIDGQISQDEAQQLDAHLATCAACRATLQALSLQDSQLHLAFAPRRQAALAVAESTIRRLHREQLRPRRFHWLNTLAAAAAGFALAAFIFQPWRPRTQPIVDVTTSQPIPASTAVAQLALATGAIEVLPPGDTTWRIMQTGAPIAANSRVRTGENIRAEFTMADGSTFRLNSGTEVAFNGPRSCNLTSGQIWSSVTTADVPFMVAVAQATVTAVGTQFDILSRPDETTVTVLEGSTRVIGQGSETIVMSGQRVKIVDGRPGQADRAFGLVMTTRWVNELLLMKGRDNAELTKRVNDMLAQLGEVKMRDLYDEEIRALGDHAVIPLTRYIQSDRSALDTERREGAARILADIAQPWSIFDLIRMVADSDEVVRYNAVRGLRRLTGTDLGFSPEECRRSAGRAREAFEAWQQWWQRNKDRYPSAPLPGGSQ